MYPFPDELDPAILDQLNGIVTDAQRPGPPTRISLCVAALGDGRVIHTAVRVVTNEMTCIYHTGDFVEDLEAALVFADALGCPVWYAPCLLQAASQHDYCLLPNGVNADYRLVKAEVKGRG